MTGLVKARLGDSEKTDTTANKKAVRQCQPAFHITLYPTIKTAIYKTVSCVQTANYDQLPKGTLLMSAG